MARVSRQRVSIKDVASVAGVSIATVSNVLTQKPTVSPVLAERVQKAVAKLGYRSDGIASSLRRLQSQVIGLVVPNFANPFFGELTAAFEAKAQAAGFRLLVTSSKENDETERNEIDSLLNWRVAGLAVVPANDTFSAMSLLENAAIPTIIMDRVRSGLPFDCVGVQNHTSAAKAVEHFCGLGHKSILVLASDLCIANVRERVSGARDAASRHGIEIEVLECGSEIPRITEAVRVRLAAPSRPTALFPLTNLGALGALKAIAGLGLSVPSDISVIGFDDYEWMQLLSPAISTIKQPIQLLAEAAWDRLIFRFGAASAPVQDVRLACELIERGSTAALHL